MVDTIENLYPDIVQNGFSAGRFLYITNSGRKASERYAICVYNYGERSLLKYIDESRFTYVAEYGGENAQEERIQYLKANAPQYLFDHNFFRICYFLTGTVKNTIAHEYCKRHASAVERISNVFPDDDTENYVAVFPWSQVEDILFIASCVTKNSYGIYKSPSIDLTRFLNNREKGTPMCIFLMSPDNLKYCYYILKNAYNECGETLSLDHFPSAYPQMYIYGSSSESVYKELGIDYDKAKELLPENKQKELYSNLRSELVAQGVIAAKWTSEYSLFETVRNMYPEAIFQYHADWLGRQSLDIYIPSIHVEIEYQGQQHYEAVEFFGGEEKYKVQVELDRRKRKVCATHGVIVIDFRYDEKINSKNVQNKIQNAIH